MLKNLTNQQKSYVFLTAMVIAILLSYNMAFRKTFRLREQCKEMQQQLTYLDKAPKQISLIRAKIEEIDRMVGREHKYLDTEELLLEKVGALCEKHNVIFKEFPGHHAVSNKDYTLVSYQMILQGGFSPLLEVLHELEMDFGYGKISSVGFFTKYNIRTGKKKLQMKLIVQSIKLKENEKNSS
jgi:hypothetical protein